MGAIGMAFSDHMLVISFQPCDLSLHGPCLEVHFPCRCSIWFYGFDIGGDEQCAEAGEDLPLSLRQRVEAMRRCSSSGAQQ